MKPKDYVKQFGLHPDGPQHRDTFCYCLRDDFLEAVESSHGHMNIAGYEQAIRVIRMKFDAIGVRIGRMINEQCWKYLYKIHIAPLREQLFPEEMRRRRKEKEARKKEREQREKEQRYWREKKEQGGDFNRAGFQEFINEIFNASSSFRDFGRAYSQQAFDYEAWFNQSMGGRAGSRRTESRRPTSRRTRSVITVDEAFRILGIDECSSITIVKKSYRALCKKVHPDVGGSAEEFIRINEAYSLICKELKGG